MLKIRKLQFFAVLSLLFTLADEKKKHFYKESETGTYPGAELCSKHIVVFRFLRDHIVFP